MPIPWPKKHFTTVTTRKARLVLRISLAKKRAKYQLGQSLGMFYSVYLMRYHRQLIYHLSRYDIVQLWPIPRMFRITNGDGKHAGRRMENVRSCLGYHVFRVMRLKGCMMCVPNDISHVVSFCCDAAAVCGCSVRMNVCLYTGHTSYMNSIPNMKMNCAKIAKYHIDPLLSR